MANFTEEIFVETLSQTGPETIADKNPAQVQIGVSRPALVVEDLPTPEEVFSSKRVGLEEIILLVLGPSLIALGISIGSGEWLLGPLHVSAVGFKGIGGIILISAILQVFYNVELGRYTIATGETPIQGFGRTPPGLFIWIPLALIIFYIAFIQGSWVVSAGESLFALVNGRPPDPTELPSVRILSIALTFSALVILALGRRIERFLEALMGVILIFVMTGLVVVTLVLVPLDFWGQSLRDLLIPALPPEGIDISLLGSLAGFTALASGLNFIFIGYYRDKGYGMGAFTGFIGSLLGEQAGSLRTVGRTFPENPMNAANWRRWFRFLLIDQWGIYFIGVLVGMIVPSILVSYLSSIPGAEAPESGTIMVYAAQQLGLRYGPLLASWAFAMGFLILYTTQIIVLELLARNFVDATFGINAGIQQRFRADPRRLYYLVLVVLIVIISGMIFITQPIRLIVISGNISNFAALIFPLIMIYLNRQLPKPARIRWWSYVVLIANVLFFGFFFVNFVYVQVNGTPLVSF